MISIIQFLIDLVSSGPVGIFTAASVNSAGKAEAPSDAAVNGETSPVCRNLCVIFSGGVQGFKVRVATTVAAQKTENLLNPRVWCSFWQACVSLDVAVRFNRNKNGVLTGGIKLGPSRNGAGRRRPPDDE